MEITNNNNNKIKIYYLNSLHPFSLLSRAGGSKQKGSFGRCSDGKTIGLFTVFLERLMEKKWEGKKREEA